MERLQPVAIPAVRSQLARPVNQPAQVPKPGPQQIRAQTGRSRQCNRILLLMRQDSRNRQYTRLLPSRYTRRSPALQPHPQSCARTADAASTPLLLSRYTGRSGMEPHPAALARPAIPQEHPAPAPQERPAPQVHPKPAQQMRPAPPAPPPGTTGTANHPAPAPQERPRRKSAGTAAARPAPEARPETRPQPERGPEQEVSQAGEPSPGST